MWWRKQFCDKIYKKKKEKRKDISRYKKEIIFVKWKHWRSIMQKGGNSLLCKFECVYKTGLFLLLNRQQKICFVLETEEQLLAIKNI